MRASLRFFLACAVSQRFQPVLLSFSYYHYVDYKAHADYDEGLCYEHKLEQGAEVCHKP